MDALLNSEKTSYEEYALRDPKIAVLYALKIKKLNFELLGCDEVPTTLSSIGVNYLLKTWQDNNIDSHRVLGTRVESETTWIPSRGHSIKRRVEVPTEDRYTHESFVNECYHGGRNEQFFFGASEEGDWTDFDLASAYTTAMSMIGLPVWDRIDVTRDVDKFQPDVLGYARVAFRFPLSTRFPCLPVRTEHGLIFPLEGESFCCAPEIYLAQSMGAQLKIIHGVILPCEFNIRPFETFIMECQKRRSSFVKKSLEELFWKELGNGTYGKTAQGLKKRRCFNTRAGDYQNLPESKITNPFVAAFTTSFVRAVVGEILARLPLQVQVSNVTTDGVLTTATAAEMDVAVQGPLCRLFAQARYRICQKLDVVEVKHRVKQVLGMRTRGQLTLIPVQGSEIVLAKAGVKPPKDLKTKEEQNRWLVDVFINRTNTTTHVMSLLRTLPEIYKHGGDLVGKEMVRKVSLEFDWKRRPQTGMTRPVNSIPHLYFDTAPWTSIDDFRKCRDDWQRFASNSSGVLKQPSDLEAFLDYRATKTVVGVRKSRRDTSVKLAVRMFIRAYVRSVWGLHARTMSYSELAQWLSSEGYPTKKEDVENANRPNVKLLDHSVPSTQVVQRFIGKVQQKFPTFQARMLLQGNSTES